MTYGEWIVHWRALCPMRDGQIVFPPDRPAKLPPEEAARYYTKKLRAAFGKDESAGKTLS